MIGTSYLSWFHIEIIQAMYVNQMDTDHPDKAISKSLWWEL